jgi:CheY-like chemotaxis protein
VLSSTAVPAVLIVEDDPCVGPELAAELQGRGYSVEWVRDAHAGSPSVSGRLRPDVVVLDYFLPRGDGLSLTRAWKTSSEPPAVVLVSGADVSTEIARRLPAGCRPDGTFAKPLSMTAFLAEIDRLAPIDDSPERDAAERQRGRRTPIESRPPTLPDILWQLWRSGRTGLLEVPGPEWTSSVHVLNGAPVFIESGTLDETLGRMMVQVGVLRGHEYERVLRKMTEGLISGDDVRFGEVAVSMGYATAEQVVDALRAQVREKLVNLFHRDVDGVTFCEGRERLLVGSAFRVETADVILEGIRRHYAPVRMEPLIHRYESRYAALSPGFDEARPALRLTPREQRFLLQIRGDRTVRALVEAGGLERVHAMQMICVLLVLDALELTQAAQPPRGDLAPSTERLRGQAAGRGDPAREDVLSRALRLGGRTHYDVLGVDPRASQPEIERAYASLSARYSPDRLVTMGLGDVHEQATEVWARITIAYETLRDSIRRDAYDQTMPAVNASGAPATRQRRSALLQAEAAFHAGTKELTAGRLGHAVVEFGRAHSLAPEEPEYTCYEIWAQCLQAIETGADVREAARHARGRMESAMVGRRPRSRALYVLALACQLFGDLDSARVYVQSALSFEPGFAEARRLADALAPPARASDVILG